MIMLRHIVLALSAAILVGTTLSPADALAHHRGYWHRTVWYLYGWGSDPRAARAGYPGGHYGRDCYRAANGRWICRFY
jgi:hypothetical protein